MSGEKALVPELRFPEFEGEWEKFKLGDRCIKVGSGVTPKGGASTYVDTGIPLIRSQNVKGDHLDLSDVVFIDAATDEKMSGSRVAAADVLLNITGASIGRSCVVPASVSAANVNQHVCIIRLKSSLSPQFIQPFLASYRGQKLIFQSQAGGGREGLNFENIRSFRVSTPTFPEQQKIATFLDAVSKKITLLTQKREALTDYKRGLMQRLFSGALRFTRPDGSAFPDWEERKLGQLGRFTGGGTPDTNVNGFWAGEIAWVSSSDISENNIHSVSISRRITDDAIKDSATQITPKGAILIVTRVGIGKCAIAPEDLCTSQDFTNFVPQTGNSRFFAYWLHFHKWRLLSLAQGTSIKGVTTVDLKKMSVEFPHPEEQSKIADALSALDAKIDAVSSQISQMEAFKKGLLQKMFV